MNPARKANQPTASPSKRPTKKPRPSQKTKLETVPALSLIEELKTNLKTKNYYLKYAVTNTELLKCAVYNFMIPFRPWSWQINVLKCLFKMEVLKEGNNCIFEVGCI